MTQNREQAYRQALQKASDQIKALLAEVNTLKHKTPVAIIGMGCRFPGQANDPEAFWAVLEQGVDTVGEIPTSRWHPDLFYHPDVERPGKSYVRYGAFLDEVDTFDADFFGITPAEAEALDPQQRLLLEVSWEALANAGQDVNSRRGSRTGVFVGMDSWDYFQAHLGSREPQRIDAYATTGVALSTAAGRLSYFYDFTGPSMTIDTACSSSLVALHLALQSLRRGECDLAIAGGVDLILTPESYIGFSQLRALAADGRCRTFDDDASGFAKGEGCGLLVLKRLADAERDGDPILALLKGSAVNHDGESNGLTAPNALAQKQVMQQALEDAHVTPDDVGYVEAHGTGTRLGDPIEIRALGMVFGGRKDDLLVGAVKTNIGHLQAAAGVAGVIKVVLALSKGMIPKNLHFHKPSRHIPWHDVPVRVCAELTPWPVGNTPRIAGVSSFGFSGTNAHVILQEAPVNRQHDDLPHHDDRFHLLTVSAKHTAALRAYAETYAHYLGHGTSDAFADVCSSSRVGQSHLSRRLALVVQTPADCTEKLAKFSRGLEAPGLYTSEHTTWDGNRDLVFLFTGQGAQYPGMGKDLFQRQAIFRRVLEQCDQLLRHHGIPLLEVLFGQSAGAHVLDQTRFTQPALFAIEYALAEMWRACGLQPAVVVGHSIGEYVAACVAGLFSLEDGLKLAVTRGELMQSLPESGMMAALVAHPEEIQALLQPYQQRISLAAVNAPDHAVISGARDAVEALLGQAQARGLAHRPLQVSHAFHSHLMEPMIEAFRQVAAGITFCTPSIPIVSNLTGNVDNGEMAHPDYWCRHIRATVRFYDAMQTLDRQGYGIFLEVGPHAVLSGLGRRCVPTGKALWLASMVRGEHDWKQVLTTLAQLYVAGQPIDWPAFDKSGSRHKVVLPGYPFQRKRYWKEPVSPRFRQLGEVIPPPAAAKTTDATQEHRRSAIEQEARSAASGPSGENKRMRNDLIIAELENIIRQIAGIEDIDVHWNLFQMGLNSIMLTKLKQRIESDFAVDIQMSQFYNETDSVFNLAEFISRHVSPEVAESLDAASPSLSPPEALATPPPPRLASAGETAPAGLQDIINQQLQLMSRQLDLLQGAAVPAPDATTTTSVARTAHGRQAAGASAAASAPSRQRARRDSRQRHDVDMQSMKLTPDELSPRQRQFIDHFSTVYTQRTQKSKALMSTYRPVFSDWLNSLGFRLSLKEIQYPIVVHRSEGSRLWDVDGNEYVDLCIGYGANYFGNRAPFITAAIEAQLQEGFQLGPQFDLTGKVAALICEITGVERVTFTNTGTEAVMTALRMARTVTGRDKIVLFEGSYHGTFDGILALATEDGTVPAAPGTPQKMVDDVLVLKYGDPRSLEIIEAHGRELAAVLVEPVQSRHPSLQPGDFLKSLREVTQKSRTALIFDEMITGFRLCPGGAQAYFDVRADVALYGKIVGGGMPIGIIAGASRFLDAIDGGVWQYGDASFPEKGVTLFGGTFCKHPLTVVAALAVLKHIQTQGPALQERVNQRTTHFAETLNAYFATHNVPLRVQHCASFFRFASYGTYDPALQGISMDLLFAMLLANGIYIWERRICFFSAAHTDDDVAQVIQAVKESVEALRAGGFPFGLEADPPTTLPQPDTALAFPLSSEQQRLYILSQLEGGEAAYHLPEAAIVEGPVDLPRLENAVRQIVARHESLRTSFEMQHGAVVQQVHPDVSIELRHLDGSEDDLNTLTQRFLEPFDLRTAPLMRMGVAHLAPSRYLLLFDVHHIVGDGLSAEIFVRELMHLYQGGTLPPMRTRYQDYVVWQQAYVQSGRFQQDEAFWRDKFSSEVPLLDLPTDHARPATPCFEGDHLYVEVDASQTRALKELVHQTASSLFMVLLAAHFTLLYRLSGQEDLVVGIPASNRPGAAFEQVIGMFVNTLAIRCQLAGTMPFARFLETLKRDLLSAYDHQAYPFASLIETLAPPRVPGRAPLFDTMFSFEIGDDRVMRVDNLTFQPYYFKPRASIGDLILEATEVGGTITLRFDYATRLFERDTIVRFAHYFQNILARIVREPDISLGAIEILSEDEQHQLLHAFNQTTAAYPTDQTIADVFEAQVEKTPDHIALVGKNESLTYGELNRRANRLAHHLIAHFDVQPDDIIGLFLDPSLATVVSILGVTKSGAAYLPIDTASPDERVALVLKDSGCKLVLTEPQYTDRLPFPGMQTLDITRMTGGSTANPVRYTTSSNLLYLLYTSGSTGTPKGCLVTHRNVVRLMMNDRSPFDFDASDVWIMAHSYSFDFSVWEMYGALLFGGRLVVPTFEEVREVSTFLNLIKTHRVSVLNQTPGAFYNVMQEDLKTSPPTLERHLRWVIFGGDRLEPAHLHPWFQRYPSDTIQLTNMYGITETTVHVTYRRMSETDVGSAGLSPIGTPLPETTVYVLDERLRPVPTGVVGEIYVGGGGVCRGYLNRPELTRQRFVTNPFGEGRLYKSGDLGRWLASGELHYLGRNDHQVQLRGYRIELGEIETQLLRHPAVAKALVIARQVNDFTQELVAYLVHNDAVAEAEPLSVAALREHLKAYLPAYMVPAFFVWLEDFPLTSNHKIDRQALPDPRSSESTGVVLGTTYQAPGSAVEKTLAAIWRGVLGQKHLGITDNFLDLGGDSIKALQIVARLNAANLKLEVCHLFAHPTIAELATYVEQSTHAEQSSPVLGEVPLTAMQRWFFARLPSGWNTQPSRDACFTQAAVLRSSHRLDADCLRSALGALQEHHDALRIRYRLQDECVIQEIAGLDYPLSLETIDLRGRTDVSSRLEQEHARVAASIDMTSGPLMKTVLFETDDGARLLMVIHHLVVDGVSWRVLIEDLNLAYEHCITGQAVCLPPKSQSFQRWAECVQAYSTSEQLLKEKAFWKAVEQARTSFPPVDSQALGDVGERGVATCRFTREETEALLKQANHVYHASLNDLLLTALARTMQAWHGANSTLIGLEGHGREDLSWLGTSGAGPGLGPEPGLDVSRTVGWFTSLYPVVVELPDSQDPVEQVRHVRAALRSIPHKGIGYGMLQYITPPEHKSDLTFQATPQVLFNYLGEFAEADSDTWFVIADEQAGNTMAPQFQAISELEIEAIVLRGKLAMSVAYRPQVFHKETIDEFLARYRTELLTMIGPGANRRGSEQAPARVLPNGINIVEIQKILTNHGMDGRLLQDAYPLSPMQEGMLFHAAYAPASTAYFEQFSFPINGPLDVALWQASLHELSRCYDVLRTVVVDRGGERPVQAVLKARTIEVDYEDLSHLDGDRQRDYLATYKSDDRRRGFDLKRDVLMRMRIFKLAPALHQVVWSFHHIVMDGWSMGILLKGVLDTYTVLKRGQTLKPRTMPSYRHYIEWLEQQDGDKARHYWQTYLAGYESPPVPAGGQPADRSDGGYALRTIPFHLSEPQTEALGALAKRQRVTLNTVVRTIWGILLSHLRKVEDVVFGAVVSGRPPGLAGVEHMVGLFINTVPVRITIARDCTFGDVARAVQAQALESEAYHYCSLADIQAATHLKQGLIDNVLVFENYPLREEMQHVCEAYDLDMTIGAPEEFEQTNYDLMVEVYPGKRLQIELNYNARVYSEQAMNEVRERFVRLATTVIEAPESKLATLYTRLMSDDERREQEKFLSSTLEVSEDF